jgi:uncharacterized protein YdeI (YjbR/CyaY-like superfamily)
MEEQLLFADREEFRKWLKKNHDTHKGFWMVLGKAGNLKTLTANEALEEALCFGWIDNLIKTVDETKYLKKFTPRRKDSVWSEINKELVKKLMENGRMTEHGLKLVEAVKKSGSWDNPQKRPPVTREQIEMFTGLLAGNEPAYTNFLNMPLSVKQTYTISYLDAKQEETRKNRLNKIIGRLNENKKPM